MRFLAFVILFAIPSILLAETPSSIYLVWKGSFTATNIDSVKTFGVKSDQPIQDFHLLSPASTWFYVLYVTTTTNLQSNVLKNLESNGKILRIKTVWISYKYEGSVGGNVVRVRKENFNSYPSEYFQGFGKLK